MYEFRFLLDRFWVTRAENKDLYFAVKRALPHYRRLVNEQLGWNLIVNEAVVKLEKVPAKAMAWMGIQEFQEKLDYCLLCALLLFLSDLDDGEQFLLSSLTEGLEALLAEVQPVDWTRFPHRKSLVRVLQYAQRTSGQGCFSSTMAPVRALGATRPRKSSMKTPGFPGIFPHILAAIPCTARP